MAVLHEAALKMLALTNETAPFENRHAEFVRPEGPAHAAIPTGFDGLSWGIIGQQINVKFASSPAQRDRPLAGEKVGDMRAHPTPGTCGRYERCGARQRSAFPAPRRNI